MRSVNASSAAREGSDNRGDVLNILDDRVVLQLKAERIRCAYASKRENHSDILGSNFSVRSPLFMQASIPKSLGK